MLGKIKSVKDMINSKGVNVDIQVDGGISPHNIDKVSVQEQISSLLVHQYLVAKIEGLQ